MRRISSVLALLLCVVAGGARADEWMDFARSQIEPMACNVYHEARGEPRLGQMMVAYVTLMRAKANRSMWGGSTILGVVFKRGQFSWTYDSSKTCNLPKGNAREQASEIATIVALGFFKPPGDLLVDALYYMNPTTADPKQRCLMATHFRQVGVVGNQYFYSEEPAWLVPSRFGCNLSQFVPTVPTS